MAWKDPQPKNPRLQERRQAKQEGKGLHRSNARSKEKVEGREREPKGRYVFHAIRVKHLPKHTTKSNKHGGNSKGMKARKVIDLDGNGAYTQGPSTTYLYPTNTWEVGHGSRV